MKYLTKSRFKLALECPTRVRYALEPEVYENQRADNPFLLALAEGGFQVGEWAKLHFPSGKDCVTRDNERALAETASWLESGEHVIFEAALRSGFKYIRVDVLQITEHEIRVIEVKSKSVVGLDSRQFFGKKGGLDSTWRSYLEDVAFQVKVATEYFKKLGWDVPVRGYLFCPDKQKRATIDGMHEHFMIRPDEENRASCKVKPGISLGDLGESMMTLVDADAGIRAIEEDQVSYARKGWECTSFHGAIEWLEELTRMNDRGLPYPMMPVGAHCASCPFCTHRELDMDGLKSGRRACFEHALGWTQKEFDRLKVWDVWSLMSKKRIIDQGRWFMDEIQQDDFKGDLAHPEELSGQSKLARAQRQWIQICAAKGTFNSTYLDKQGLQEEILQFTWPLHFIDFETTAPAIPFYKGYAPYQGVSFQFSHHVLHADGRLEHAGQFLGLGQGEDPTYEFVKRLYDNLNGDEGSVFMYSHHENSYLNYAHRLLRASTPFDEDETNELLRFLESLTRPTDEKHGTWPESTRVMVDMLEMVKTYFWHPDMAGSNSIKAVLPAVLNASAELQAKYKAPLYGSDAMPSLNYDSGFSWIQFDEEGKVRDPYKLLPALKQDILGEDLETINRVYGENFIGNGGAAMTAWSYMQFAEMTEEEREDIQHALKKYCELDTLAMAFIMEYFLIELKKE